MITIYPSSLSPARQSLFLITQWATPHTLPPCRCCPQPQLRRLHLLHRLKRTILRHTSSSRRPHKIRSHRPLRHPRPYLRRLHSRKTSKRRLESCHHPTGMVARCPLCRVKKITKNQSQRNTIRCFRLVVSPLASVPRHTHRLWGISRLFEEIVSFHWTNLSLHWSGGLLSILRYAIMHAFLSGSSLTILTT